MLTSLHASRKDDEQFEVKSPEQLLNAISLYGGYSSCDHHPTTEEQALEPLLPGHQEEAAIDDEMDVVKANELEHEKAVLSILDEHVSGYGFLNLPNSCKVTVVSASSSNRDMTNVGCTHVPFNEFPNEGVNPTPSMASLFLQHDHHAQSSIPLLLNLQASFVAQPQDQQSLILTVYPSLTHGTEFLEPPQCFTTTSNASVNQNSLFSDWEKLLPNSYAAQVFYVNLKKLTV